MGPHPDVSDKRFQWSDTEVSPQGCPIPTDRDWYLPSIDRLREVKQLPQSHLVPDTGRLSALWPCLHGPGGGLEEVELAASDPSPSSPMPLPCF